MQNSYEKSLQGLYRHLLADVVRTFPTYHQEAERDLSRILQLIEKNGMSVLTIQFPAMGKAFDKALSEQILLPTHIMGFRPYRKGSSIPRLFKGLWMMVFDDDGVPWDDPDINAILMLRQLLNAAKKLRRPCDDSKTIQTVREFFRLDRSLRLPTLSWGGERIDLDAVGRLHLSDGGPTLYKYREPNLFDGLGGVECESRVLDAIQQVADIVSTSLGWFDPADWRPRHGPGAVADARLGKSSKYSFPTWPAKLDRIFPMDNFGFANAASWVDHLVNNGSTHTDFEKPSKLIAVPKTQKAPRLIASEPTCHQWAQQTIRNFLTIKVCQTPIGHAISFRDQRPNQVMARSASQTGSHVTMDLSSASDCVSCWLVERIFRRNLPLLEALHASRTRWLVNQITHEPKYTMLRKFAAMGAATTFPVQTIIYAIVIAGVMLDNLGLTPSPANIRMMSNQIRVFGDDLVIPKAVGTSVASVLTHLGFKVNADKTHGCSSCNMEGFRESCGGEYYGGHDVTPAYFLDFYDKSRPTTVATTVESSNNFFLKGFWETAEWLKSTLPQSLQQELPVVKTVSGQFGFRSFSGTDVSHLKQRWNRDTQKSELRVARLTAKAKRMKSNTDAELLQFFTEEPEPDVLWESGYAQRPTVSVSRGWVPAEELVG